MIAYSSNNFKTRDQQRGAILILSMILLMVLTILGISSMRTATMEERMANNMRERNLAFESAESALREAESWLDQQTSRQQVLNTNFVYTLDSAPDVIHQTHAWWKYPDNAAAYGIVSPHPIQDVGDQPRFIITESSFVKDSVEFGSTSGIQFYIVTARGTGATDSSESILQSTVAKRYN